MISYRVTQPSVFTPVSPEIQSPLSDLGEISVLHEFEVVSQRTHVQHGVVELRLERRPEQNVVPQRAAEDPGGLGDDRLASGAAQGAADGL